MFLHLNVRSIKRRQLQIKNLMSVLGAHCNYGLSETWLELRVDLAFKDALYDTLWVEKTCLMI